METTTQTSHWILLRGLAREARHWDDFPARLERALAQRGDRARVDALDMPGSGRYSEMKAPLSIGETTEFAREKFIEIRRKIREAGGVPPERTRLVAVSMGGMIAADWVDRWPDDFKELVLINTSFSGFSKFYERLRPAAVRSLLASVRARTSVDRELSSLALVSNRTEDALALETARRWAAFGEDRPFSLENFTRQLVASARFRAPAEAPSVPTLVLSSARDRMVSPECSRAIARRWKVPSFEHPWAGHDLTLDDGDWVIEKTLEWESGMKEIPDRPKATQAGP